MKIALISEYNSFTTTGGTEYYVSMLAEGLCSRDHEVILISRGKHSNGIDEQFINVGGKSYKVCLLPADIFTAIEIKQHVISSSWGQMKPVLEAFAPDVVHVHTLSTFFNIRHLEICQQLNPIIVFTSHVPGHFCAKGDLIRNNTAPCNGKIGGQCIVCLFSKGSKQGVINILKGYALQKKRLLKQMSAKKIELVCVSDWQKKQLIANGFPAGNLSVIRQALRVSELTRSLKQLDSYGNPSVLRVGYLGRLSPEKGSALLIDLLSRFKGRTDIHFVLGVPSNSNRDDLRRLNQLIATNVVSIELRMDVTADSKQDFFSAIDCLFIPSFFIETGPIVLLESLFYQRFVIAPNIGGPQEFAEEFPNSVHSYLWNNADAAEACINKVKDTICEGMGMLTIDFNKRANDFIQKHLLLYQRLSSQRKN